jgi:hypothetical protein
MKHNRIIILTSVISLAVLILILNLTSPTEIGPSGVLLFFTTVYVVIFGLTTLLIKLFYSLALKRTHFRNKDYLYAAVAAFGPVMLLMARSFGAVTIWTIGLIAFFVALVEFFVCKRV